MEVHHIIYRQYGGADTLDNLIVLCWNCHRKLHDGELVEFEKKLKGKKKGTLKHATQMNSIRKQLPRHYPMAIETYGYITKENRQLLGLEKTHSTDALVIACGGKVQPKRINKIVYKKRHIAKGKYKLFKGERSQTAIPNHKIMGFLTGDKVEYRGTEYFIKATSNAKYCVLVDIDDVTQEFENPKTIKLEDLKRISGRSTTQCIKERIA